MDELPCMLRFAYVPPDAEVSAATADARYAAPVAPARVAEWLRSVLTTAVAPAPRHIARLKVLSFLCLAQVAELMTVVAGVIGASYDLQQAAQSNNAQQRVLA
jgi:hypothetical protein